MPRVAQKKETASRPSTTKPRRVSREERVPVNGTRDILTVYGKKDDLAYRWISDKSEDGQRVFRFEQAGWFLVPADDVKIGQSAVYQSESVGSIVRLPDGGGSYLYLMAIEKDLYDEDQIAKQDAIKAEENAITRERDENEDDGQYGKNKLGFDLR